MRNSDVCERKSYNHPGTWLITGTVERQTPQTSEPGNNLSLPRADQGLLSLTPRQSLMPFLVDHLITGGTECFSINLDAEPATVAHLRIGVTHRKCPNWECQDRLIAV